jgi:hypothetical protein
MYISDLQGGEVVKIEAAPRMLRFRVDATGSPDFLIGFQGFQTFREQFQSVFPRTRNSVENFPRIAAGVFPWRNPILPGTFNPCNGQEDLINNDDVPDNNNAFERGARFYWDTGFTLFARTGQVGGVDGDVCASNYNELQQYDNISINFHSSPIRKVINVQGAADQVDLSVACSCLQDKLIQIPHQFIGNVTDPFYAYPANGNEEASPDSEFLNTVAPITISIGSYQQNFTFGGTILDPQAQTYLKTEFEFPTSAVGGGRARCADQPRGVGSPISRFESWDVTAYAADEQDQREIRPRPGGGSPEEYVGGSDSFCPDRLVFGAVGNSTAYLNVYRVYDDSFGYYSESCAAGLRVAERPNDGLTVSTTSNVDNFTSSGRKARVGKGIAAGIGESFSSYVPQSPPWTPPPQNTSFGSMQQRYCDGSKCRSFDPSDGSACWAFLPGSFVGPYFQLSQNPGDDPNSWPYNNDACDTCSSNNPFTAYQSNNTNGDNPFVPVQPRSNAFPNIHDTRFFVNKYYGVDADKVAPLNYLADKIVDGECVTMLCPNNNDSDNYCLQLQDCVS